MALDRAAVVDAALDLLDEVGLDNLTLRRLADRLGVKAPAIYWHVRDKRELLDEMATSMLRAAVGVQPPDLGSLSWPELLTQIAVGLRAALMSRRDGGKLYGGSLLTDPEVLAGSESTLRRLVDLGFTPQRAAQATRTIFCFVLGFVIEQQGTQGREDLFDPEARRDRIDDRAHPLSADAGQVMFGDFDTQFATGVETLVAGIRGRGISSGCTE